MIIDNPHIFREVIAETNPYFTHKGAEEVVTQMKDDIDAYAGRYGAFADKIWREEYLKSPMVTECVLPSEDLSATV
jgi:hypothetical protein